MADNMNRPRKIQRHTTSSTVPMQIPKPKPAETTEADGPGGTVAQRELRLAEMAALIRRGWTQSMLSARFKLTHSQVKDDCDLLLGRLAEDVRNCSKELVALKLAEYAEIKMEAWEAWEKSKEDAVKKVQETSTSPMGKRTRAGRYSEGRVGDSQHLRTILSCLEAERELLAINPATRVNVEGTMVNWDVLASGIPDGPVPDEVEMLLQQASRGSLSVGISTTATPLPQREEETGSEGEVNGGRE